ncbi:MAG: hypothetical protein NUV67_05815 [archaeon]|nr:hypothetical protein [archaeon]
MKKGQLSIDVLLSLIIAIAFFLALQGHIEGLGENTAKAGIGAELFGILLETHSAIGSATAHNQTIEFTSPTLEFRGELLNCEIEIDLDSIRVVHNSPEYGVISKTFEGVELSGINPATFGTYDCGQTITITGVSP